MRMLGSLLFPLLASMAVASCATAPAMQADGVTFVVVRHAEKATDDPRDPGLNTAGQRRAMTLARQFAGRPVVAAYATGYRRTQQTAGPSAHAAGIPVTTYAAAQPAAALADDLRRRHAKGTVLVVGHSNTVPEIVAALCGCAVAAMGDGDYDRLYTVAIDAAGHAVLSQRTY